MTGEHEFAEAVESGADTLLVAFEENPARWLDLLHEGLRRAGASIPDIYASLPMDAPDWLDRCGSAIALLRGIVIGSADPRDIERIAGRLAVAEAENGLEDGQLLIFPKVADARSTIMLAAGGRDGSRLAGLIFDETALCAGIGAKSGSEPVRTARGLAVLAAHAMQLRAIAGSSMVAADVAMDAGCDRRDGFSAKIATSSDELRTIARVFDA